MAPEKRSSYSADDDGGFGWVVVFASFVLHALVLGSMYSFGVYYPIYLNAFPSSSKGEVACVGSIGAALMVAMGLWSGVYADRYGNRLVTFVGAVFIGSGYFLASFATQVWHLYFTQGFLTGIGYSLTFIAGVAVVGQWFTDRRGLAIGIAVAGSGVGQFAVSQWTMVLINHVGWRKCLRWNALISFVGLVLCSSVLIRKIPLNRQASAITSMTQFHNPAFRLLYAANACFSMGFFMPFTYFPLYAESQGISTAKAVFILSIAGLAGTIGRIALGFIADTVGKLATLQISVFGAGCTLLCWSACKSWTSLLIIGVAYGGFSGGIIALIPAVCAERFGVEFLSSIVGLLFTANTWGNLVSTPLAGFLVDKCGSYHAAIGTAGSFFLVASVFYFFIGPVPRSEATDDTTSGGISVASEGTSGHYELIVSNMNSLDSTIIQSL
jgi:MFS family permease